MAKKEHKKLDPTMERIAKEAADQTGILTSQMKEAYQISMELFMKNIRKGNPVLIPNMGYFFLSPYKTERLITRMFMSMRNRLSGKDPEGMTREDVKEKLNKYWPLHEKARTHKARTGKRYRAKKRRSEVSGQEGSSGEL